MSDFELINKAAHRIYPTHLKEVDNSSFSWSGVLPTDAKSRLVKDSEGHKQTDDRNSHTLTHKLKGGASIEFNIVQNGKNHIAMAKYHKGGKLYTAIHSHEDPSTAIKTAYDSVARRIVTEEAEIALIEKMEKRIEKKTGKLSDKKEKIDVEPSEEKEYQDRRGSKTVLVHPRNVELHEEELNEVAIGNTVKLQSGHHLHVTGFKFAKGTQLGSIPRVGIAPLPGSKVTHYIGYLGSTPMEASRGYKKVEIPIERAVKGSELNSMRQPVKRKNPLAKLSEDELNELSKKTLASYVKKSNRSSFELGYDAASNEFHDDGDYKKTQKDEKKALKRQRFVNKAIDKLAEAEYPTDTKQGILARLDYHHDRENYHRQSAEMNHRKANKFTLGSENYKLYKNVAKGQEALAKHHHKSIQDLHKKFATMNETEQLDELSPSALGTYIKFAAIDKSKHAAHGAISDMAMYNAQNRGDKKDAQREKERGDAHRKKEDKRTSGILTATDKLVRKAHGLHEASRPAPHPDKVVMTSSIRKDLGGGYMAKTRNGHFYKLDVNALGEPGKGRELPNLGTVLDTSKHKFIGKDKVDLNLLKESLEESLRYHEIPSYLHSLGNELGTDLHFHKESRMSNPETGTRDYVFHTAKLADHVKARIKKDYPEAKLGMASYSQYAPEHQTHVIVMPGPKVKAKTVKPIKEELDHDHPDMKAYHAACKARDEAHLASIRYRMNHDIKQPEHRAKYDELEAEHHRLRDIEDQASEKVHGRLFAHHALKESTIHSSKIRNNPGITDHPFFVKHFSGDLKYDLEGHPNNLESSQSHRYETSAYALSHDHTPGQMHLVTLIKKGHKLAGVGMKYTAKESMDDAIKSLKDKEKK